jgi:hypothetical protein
LDVANIKDRLERTRIFKDYLDAQWHRGGFPPMAFHWPTVLSELRHDIEEAKSRNEMRQQRASRRK